MTIDGTPIEVFEEMGRKFNDRMKMLAEKSTFAGDIAQRINVVLENKKMSAEVFHSASPDTRLKKECFFIKDPVDLIEKLHQKNILCSTDVSYLFDDRDEKIQWVHDEQDNMSCSESLYEVIGVYSDCELSCRAYKLCDNISIVEKMASKRSLDEMETCTLEFDDIFLNRDLRTQYDTEKKPYLNFYWNERNWIYEYSVAASWTDGGVQFDENDIGKNDIIASIELNGEDPYRGSISVICHKDVMIFEDMTGVCGTVESLYRRFSEFKEKGAVFYDPLYGLSRFCEICHRFLEASML